MNKRHYEHTLPNIRGSLSNTYKSGEFVGSAAHSNMRDFHLRFEMYGDKEDPLPIVHPVLASDIEENYQQIIKDIQGIE